MTAGETVRLVAVLALVPLLAALYALGRVRELHHGYYGLGLALLLGAPVPLALRVACLLVGLDDVMQHCIQWRQFARGEPITYRSPAHLFGHWIGLY